MLASNYFSHLSSFSSPLKAAMSKPSFQSLCTVEVQLVLQMLALPCILKLARCNRALRSAAASPFTFKYLPPLDPVLNEWKQISKMSESAPLGRYPRFAAKIQLHYVPAEFLGRIERLSVAITVQTYLIYVKPIFLQICRKLRVLRFDVYFDCNILCELLEAIVDSDVVYNLETFQIYVMEGAQNNCQLNSSKVLSLITKIVSGTQHPRLSSVRLAKGYVNMAVLSALAVNPMITSLNLSEGYHTNLIINNSVNHCDMLNTLVSHLSSLSLPSTVNYTNHWMEALSLSKSITNLTIGKDSAALVDVISVNKSIKNLELVAVKGTALRRLAIILRKNKSIHVSGLHFDWNSMFLEDLSDSFKILLESLHKQPITSLFISAGGRNLYNTDTLAALVTLLDANPSIRITLSNPVVKRDYQPSFRRLKQHHRCRIE